MSLNKYGRMNLLISVTILFLSVFPASTAQAKISPENEKLIAMGTLTLENRQFIAQIKRDLKINSIPVKVLLGPYNDIVGPARLVNDFPRSYYVLVDKNFYENLSALEKRSVIAHEMGHVIFTATPPVTDQEAMRLQVGADLFASRYVGIDALISLLNKLFPEDYEKDIPEYLFRIKVLKELQGE